MGLFRVDPKKKIERLKRRAAAGNMRAQQKVMTSQAYEQSQKQQGAPTITEKELAGAARVGEGIGQAGAQALLQGGMSPANPEQLRAAQEGAAASTAAVTGQAVGALSKVKEAHRAALAGRVAQGGESQWKQNMASWELAMKGAAVGLSGAGALGA